MAGRHRDRGLAAARREPCPHHPARGPYGGALRSLPRFGYRLNLDSPACCGIPCPGLAVSGFSGRIAAPPSARRLSWSARAAIAARKWKEAAAAFAAADAADALLPADLEDWALAIECCGRPPDSIPLLTRAVAGYSMGGQRLLAAHAALTLTRLHVEKGELAVAGGWHKRAASLIGAAHDSREHGLWCYAGSRLALAEW